MLAASIKARRGRKDRLAHKGCQASRDPLVHRDRKVHKANQANKALRGHKGHKGHKALKAILALLGRRGLKAPGALKVHKDPLELGW
jgi:hypothetical protein